MAEWDEECWSWRSNFISWPRVFGMHSTWMQTERNHCWTTQRNVGISEFLLEQLKNYQGRRKPHAKTVAWSHDVGGHAKKVRWKRLRTGEQKDSTAVHSFKSLLGWSSIQEGGAWISERIIQLYAHNFVLTCSWLARIGRPDFSWTVSKLARSVTKWTSMWPTIGTLDLLYSSHEWLPAILSCV